MSDIANGYGALPLDDIKSDPFFPFPAGAVDNCTRAPVEPAAEVCPDLNLQTESPWDRLDGFLFDLSAQNLFDSGTVKWCVMPQFNDTRLFNKDAYIAHCTKEQTSLPLLLYSHSTLHFNWLKVSTYRADFMAGMRQFCVYYEECLSVLSVNIPGVQMRILDQ